MEVDGFRCPHEFARRRSSESPRRPRSNEYKRSPSEEPRVVSKLDDLGRSVAKMQSFIDMEVAKREAKEAKKREREAEKKREEEEALAIAEARKAEELRNLKKQEKLRRREEEREAITKVVDVQVALRLCHIPDVIKAEVCQAITENFADLKGKAIALEDVPSTSMPAEVRSQVEEITDETKRGEETPVGDIPPLTTPAKRASRRSTIRPQRLDERLKSRTIQMKATKFRIAQKAMTGIKTGIQDNTME
ncbi:hypothetical protein CBR_g34998 [Chara braunii]|uniref:Uncharacterized protein n=1 Tax=Chara braunii TaxID=69332 RepID=A0A388LJY0_CHABU|nr:hypothetical protein CBR_g34998 [Chara braunii]|eukprot:GBG82628.1 hypothetical protein CBR_g34998 [Chara braunii]